MAKYRNTKNGVVIDSPSIIAGKNWEEVIDGEVKEEAEKMVEEKAEETETPPEEGLDGVTVKEIKQELDAMGIEYDPRARKETLYNLMLGK